MSDWNALVPEYNVLDLARQASRNPYLQNNLLRRPDTLTAGPERPNDYLAPVSEAISPTMGAYGLGQAAGSVGTSLMDRKAPDAADMAALAMAFVPGFKGKGEQPQGIRAYHGSPHDFDKFDLSKRFTGEGGNTYGVGINLTSDENYAKLYRDPQLQGREKNGRTYEVNINAKPEEMLDWDKAVSEHPAEVKQKLLSAISALPEEQQRALVDQGLSKYTTGGGLAYALDRVLPEGEVGPASTYYNRGPSSSVTDFFKNAGIPGHTYQERANNGTRNYVVFDDKLIDIIRKYGIAAAASMYGMDAVKGAMQQGGNALLDPQGAQ